MTPLSVAVIGAGPAGAYAAGHLLRDGQTRVQLIDRLPTPWGLVRAGVAPDHQHTKAVTRQFEWTARAPEVTLSLGVELGRHITHAELLKHHDAVIYAVGAAGSRGLAIEGEDLPGSHPATDFVGWYNGHPDHARRSFDLSGRRAVIIGNGNVALDVARVLTLGEAALGRTDIAEDALRALAAAEIEEVVVLGRRGPAQAAFTSPELLALSRLPDVDVVVDPAEAAPDAASRAWLASGAAGFGARLKTELLAELATRPAVPGRRRIVLRFLSSPLRLLGSARVAGVEIARNAIAVSDGRLLAAPTGETEVLDADLVLRAAGYRGSPLPGLPFDAAAATLPTRDGRVLGAPGGEPLPGVYATGWIRRGPSGVIGTNKQCSGEVVAALRTDHGAGRLRRGDGGADAVRELLRARCPEELGVAGWTAIDAHERAAGERAGRPRIKLTDTESMFAVAGEGSV